MINIREILNPTYNFVGLLFIILWIVIILMMNKNIKYASKLISNTFLISGFITLFLDLMLFLFLKLTLSSYYKVIIEIISNNVLRSCFYYSIFSIGIGIIFKIILKVNFFKKA